MVQGGGRPKYDYISQHLNTCNLVVDNIQSDIDHNLFTRLLHENCGIEQSPKHQQSQLITCKHAHTAKV